MAIIQVDELVKRYGDRTTLSGVSFSVDEGEIFGILGPNGAGKTTTVECIAALREPDGGSIRVCGLDPKRDARDLRQVLGVQLQEAALPDKLTVSEAMRLYSSFYRDPSDWRRLVDELELGDKLNTPFKKLSGGQKQRLSIGLALVGNPRVAILDELTTGLDPHARRDTWGLIERVRDRGVTVLLVTHFMDEAERLCDRLAIVDGGRVTAIDSPTGLVAKAQLGARIQFRTTKPMDPSVLDRLPQVITVDVAGRDVTVTGNGDLLLAVTSELGRHSIVPDALRVEQPSLEDAFVSLIGTTQNGPSS